MFLWGLRLPLLRIKVENEDEDDGDGEEIAEMKSNLLSRDEMPHFLIANFFSNFVSPPFGFSFLFFQLDSPFSLNGGKEWLSYLHNSLCIALSTRPKEELKIPINSNLPERERGGMKII